MPSARRRSCSTSAAWAATGRPGHSSALRRGINFQIKVEAIDPLLARLAAAGVALFQPVETRTYDIGGSAVTQRQFCVLDPDGYLLRFFEVLG